MFEIPFKNRPNGEESSSIASDQNFIPTQTTQPKGNNPVLASFQSQKVQQQAKPKQVSDKFKDISYVIKRYIEIEIEAQTSKNLTKVQNDIIDRINQLFNSTKPQMQKDIQKLSQRLLIVENLIQSSSLKQSFEKIKEKVVIRQKQKSPFRQQNLTRNQNQQQDLIRKVQLDENQSLVDCKFHQKGISVQLTNLEMMPQYLQNHYQEERMKRKFGTRKSSKLYDPEIGSNSKADAAFYQGLRNYQSPQVNQPQIKGYCPRTESSFSNTNKFEISQIIPKNIAMINEEGSLLSEENQNIVTNIESDQKVLKKSNFTNRANYARAILQSTPLRLRNNMSVHNLLPNQTQLTEVVANQSQKRGRSRYSSKDRFNTSSGGSQSIQGIKLKNRLLGKADVDWESEFKSMTPRSQSRARIYFDEVMRPQGAFLEGKLYENDPLIQEQDSYQVEQHQMETFKHLNNAIVCDDKQSVSIIDPETMTKKVSIQPPTEDSILQCAYQDQRTETLFLAYRSGNNTCENSVKNSGKIIGLDNQSFDQKTEELNLKKTSCLKFTPYHADDNFVILSCEKGIISIFQPSSNSEVESFSLDVALQEEKSVDIDSEQDRRSDCHVGDIIDVVKTINVNKTNEYMVCTQQGLFFVKIEMEESKEKTAKFKFELNQDEKYFEDSVKGAFEYKEGQIIAIVNSSTKISFIDRYKKDQDKNSIANLSQQYEYLCLQPFPNYDYAIFPYVVIKDTQCLNVINVRTMQSRVLVKNSPYYQERNLTSMMDIQMNSGGNPSVATLYMLELEYKAISGASSCRESNVSTIRKYRLDLQGLNSCFK